MTESQIQEQIDAYLAAEMKVLNGQAVTHNGKTWTMANLSEIRKGRQEWERKLASFRGGRRFARVSFAQD
nr:hypothetical protein 17 [Pseudomonadaceae bacterium]